MKKIRKKKRKGGSNLTAPKPPKLIAPKPFKDIKFDRSLIIILLSILIIISSFIIYINQEPPLEKFPVKDISFPKKECDVNSDCPQPKCPGIENQCKNGYCIIKHLTPTKTVCYDLNVCGKNKPC